LAVLGGVRLSISVVLTLGFFALTAPAQAALVELGEGRDPRLTVTALPGERNTVVAFATSVGGTLRAEITDSTAALTAGPGCTQVDAGTVHCATDSTVDLQIDLGDGDDSASEEGTFQLVMLNGGDGDDRLSVLDGGALTGGAGDDQLRGSAGPEQLSGGPGNDVMDGFGGRDHLYGGSGDDVARGGTDIDSVYGGPERRGVTDESAGRDHLSGGPGSDYLYDGDTELGTVGPDVLDGGPGADTVVSYSLRRAPIRVDLARPGGDGESGEGDSLLTVEKVWGGRGNDVLLGNASANTLRGMDGVNVVRGRGGDDRLEVDGQDRASGGPGDDHFHGGFGPWNGQADCGRGRDVLTSYYWQYDARDQQTAPGPLVHGSCEWLLPRRLGLAIDPVPAGAGARLTFRFTRVACCQTVLALTRPASPFTSFAARAVRSRRAAMRVPREAGPVLRGTVARPRETEVEWRFRVPR
jgi:Ca2+-binding RTX toxin-like protein